MNLANGKGIRKDWCSLAEHPKGEWVRMSHLSEEDDYRYKCSRCGNVVHHKSRIDLYTFNSWCGRCGSDNSTPTPIIEADKTVYDSYTPYQTKAITDDPLLMRIDCATIIAFFRCNSCYTCKWRAEVIDHDPKHDIYDCSRWHEKVNLIDMVSYLGYSKEGRENDLYPKYEGD